MKGLYIHIPFCVKKCSYCDFYSLPAPLHARESYVNAVLHESETYAGMSFQTMYLGGGTPSLLGGKLVTDLIYSISKSMNLADMVESTIEVNPESTTSGFLEAIKAAGINRVSIGVQSLDDSELKAAGRIHTAAQALETVILAKRRGFKAVSADLIIGLPGQTWLTLSRSLDTLVHSGIEHLSLYCLSLEEGTPLAKSPPDDLPSDDMQAELFQYASSFLEKRHYVHYEISNFALKGYECRHNLNYWRGGEYLGLPDHLVPPFLFPSLTSNWTPFRGAGHNSAPLDFYRPSMGSAGTILALTPSFYLSIRILSSQFLSQIRQISIGPVVISHD